jgi:hypothetical protein
MTKKKVTKKRQPEDPGGGPIARLVAVLAGVVAVSFVVLQLLAGSKSLDRDESIIAVLIAIPAVLAGFATVTYEPGPRLILLGAAAGALMSLGVLAVFNFGIALLMAGFLAIMAALRVKPQADERSVRLAGFAAVVGVALPFLSGFLR